jgi:hypothetical protein
MVHCGAAAAQGSQQTIGQYLIVFSNQNTHLCLLLLPFLGFASPSWGQGQILGDSGSLQSNLSSSAWFAFARLAKRQRLHMQ